MASPSQRIKMQMTIRMYFSKEPGVWLGAIFFLENVSVYRQSFSPVYMKHPHILTN